MRRFFTPGAAVVYLFLVLLIIGPWLAPQDPSAVNLGQRLIPPGAAHWFGTDQLGRDIFSRILTGGRATVGISLSALAMSVFIGVPFGLFAGYRGGRIDWVLMRVVDSFMALPEYVVAIIISGLLGPGFFNLLLAIAVVKWVGYARLVRCVVMQEKTKDYLLVSKICGASITRILGRHMLPHVVSPVLALATLDIGKIILLVASLSFIGLGVQPPLPEWGAMLSEGKAYFTQAEYMMFIPGIAIFIVVFSVNWLGGSFAKKYETEQSEVTTDVA